MLPMSVVCILAITVAAGLGDGVEHLVAARALTFRNHDGFERARTACADRCAAVPNGSSFPRWADEASLEAFAGGSTFTARDLADRIASFGGPESLTGDVWSYRVAVDSAT
jgi:hypothetical protein